MVEPATEERRRLIKDLIAKVANSRSWVLGPPFFVDETETEDLPPGEQPLVTVGGALELHSTLAPHQIPIEVDRQELEQAEALVAAVWDLSDRTGLSFAFEYDGDQIGEIESGMVDAGLSVGLLDEWRKGLAERQ